MGFALFVLGVAIWVAFMWLMQPSPAKVPPDRLRAALPAAVHGHYDRAHTGISAALAYFADASDTLSSWYRAASKWLKIAVIVAAILLALALAGLAFKAVAMFIDGAASFCQSVHLCHRPT